MSQTYSQPVPATSRAAPTGGDRRVRWLLLGVWAGLTGAALAFVLVLGSNAPYADEWEFVPVLLGHEPAGPWLWAQHNEHRLPLPRAIYLGLFALTHNFRAGAVLQVAVLSALSLGLMTLAARLRGRPYWADVFFPVCLLHLGHWENFIMGYQLCFALAAVLTAGLGVVALRTTRETAFGSGAAAGLLAVLLGLCGGFGLPVALAASAWVAYLAAVAWRTGPGWRAAVLLVLAVLPVVYSVVYFEGYRRPEGHPPPSFGLPAALVTGEVLAVGLGIGVAGVWWAVAAGVLALLGFTLKRLVNDGRDPGRRPGVVGVVAVWAGVLGLAVAIGVGRSGFVGGERMGLWSRYALLSWPLVGLVYLVWAGRGGRGGKWVPIGLCVAAAFAFPTNMGTGMLYAARHRATYSAMEAEARAGVPGPEVAARHHRGSPHEALIARAIPMLRQAGVSGFAGEPR